MSKCQCAVKVTWNDNHQVAILKVSGDPEVTLTYHEVSLLLSELTRKLAVANRPVTGLPNCHDPGCFAGIDYSGRHDPGWPCTCGRIGAKDD